MTIEKIARDELRERIAGLLQGYFDIETPKTLIEDLNKLLTSAASYRAGAEDMRERAASLCSEQVRDLRHDPRHRASACNLGIAIRSLPLPDPQPTPTQESRDV